MNLLQSIHKLPKIEKIKIMEFLWQELSNKEEQYASPKWHQNVLKETEENFAKGKEKLINWNEAKQRLRTELK